MFGFSFGESLLIVLVALMILGPKELIELVKSSKKLVSYVQKGYNSYLKYFQAELEGMGEKENTEIVNYILDLDGKMQRTYDLSKVMPDLKRNIDE